MRLLAPEKPHCTQFFWDSAMFLCTTKWNWQFGRKWLRGTPWTILIMWKPQSLGFAPFWDILNPNSSPSLLRDCLDRYKLVFITGLTGLTGAGAAFLMAAWETPSKAKSVENHTSAELFLHFWHRTELPSTDHTPSTQHKKPTLKYSLLRNWIINNIYVSILYRHLPLSPKTSISTFFPFKTTNAI